MKNTNEMKIAIQLIEDAISMSQRLEEKESQNKNYAVSCIHSARAEGLIQALGIINACLGKSKNTEAFKE